MTLHDLHLRSFTIVMQMKLDHHVICTLLTNHELSATKWACQISFKLAELWPLASRRLVFASAHARCCVRIFEAHGVSSQPQFDSQKHVGDYYRTEEAEFENIQ